MDLSGLNLDQKEPPELARLDVHQWRWRIGKLFQLDGTFEGIKIEIYMPMLPWLKLHFPLTRLEAHNFVRALTETLEEGANFEPTGMDGDNPETETTA